MSHHAVLGLWRDALTLTAQVALPLLLVLLVVGLVASLLQAATQLQESILSFAPKLAAMLVVLWLGGDWMLARLQIFAAQALAAPAHSAELPWRP